jgi:hypothetical protein
MTPFRNQVIELQTDLTREGELRDKESDGYRKEMSSLMAEKVGFRCILETLGSECDKKCNIYLFPPSPKSFVFMILLSRNDKGQFLGPFPETVISS